MARLACGASRNSRVTCWLKFLSAVSVEVVDSEWGHSVNEFVAYFLMELIYIFVYYWPVANIQLWI